MRTWVPWSLEGTRNSLTGCGDRRRGEKRLLTWACCAGRHAGHGDGQTGRSQTAAGDNNRRE